MMLFWKLNAEPSQISNWLTGQQFGLYLRAIVV